MQQPPTQATGRNPWWVPSGLHGHPDTTGGSGYGCVSMHVKDILVTPEILVGLFEGLMRSEKGDTELE